MTTTPQRGGASAPTQHRERCGCTIVAADTRAVSVQINYCLTHAAAHEMLTLLQEYVDTHPGGAKCPYGRTADYCDQCSRARALLAHIKGRT